MTHKDRAECRKQMVKDIEAGASLGEVAIKYDVTINTVRKACYAAGCLVLGKSRLKIVVLLAALLNTKGTLHQIAESLDLDYGNVARIYRQCINVGIKLPERKRGRPLTTR